MAKKPGSSGRGQRDLRVKVKTARGRKLSSTRWLERQLNDPYVQRAKREGFRGRAAYKISELDDKYRFLVPGARVVDLGCAPGGWCQVAVQRVNALGDKSGKARGTVLGVDLQEVEPIVGADIHVLDFLDEGAGRQGQSLARRRGGCGHVGHGRGQFRSQGDRPFADHNAVRSSG